MPLGGSHIYAALRCKTRAASCAILTAMQIRTSHDSQAPRDTSASPGGQSLALPSARRVVVALALFVVSSATPLRAEQADLAEAMRRQQSLLDRAAEPSLLEGVEDNETNPRIAPRTPIPRVLPVAIFDEEKVVVAENAWGNNRRMTLLRRVLDADGDGKPEVERFIDPKSDLMVREIRDRNYDGIQDTWSDFEWGAVSARVLDTNDDGNPDTWETYADGRMVHREVDRDDDGIRDAFYFYEGDDLTKEQHDTNNDGRIDLEYRFQGRRRTRAEEDHDHDGRVDIWTVFSRAGVRELAIRIDRDTAGRGFPDTFEYFDIVDDQAVLARREKDMTGDREIDVVSIYHEGRLVRREIADPALLPAL